MKKRKKSTKYLYLTSNLTKRPMLAFANGAMVGGWSGLGAEAIWKADAAYWLRKQTRQRTLIGFRCTFLIASCDCICPLFCYLLLFLFPVVGFLFFFLCGHRKKISDGELTLVTPTAVGNSCFAGQAIGCAFRDLFSTPSFVKPRLRRGE